VRQLDLEQLPAAAAVVDELADELGGQLWALVNNAGGGSGGPLLEMPYGQWRTRMRVNLDGAFLCLQRAARRMTGGGRIVCVTRVHEHAPRVGSADYVAAGHPARAARRRPRGGGGRRLPVLGGRLLRHGLLVRRGRRTAADGAAAGHERVLGRLARRLTLGSAP
jgi:hypothetical protein